MVPKNMIKNFHTSVPSAHSTTNLCWSMTRSRSPCSYFINLSSWAQRVSKRFPARGLTGSDENSPIQRNPEMILSLSDTLGKLQISLMRATKVLENDGSHKMIGYREIKKGTHLSFASLVPRVFCMTWAQVNPSFNHTFSEVSNHPSWTSALINSGNPWYLKVPRITVSASGML